MVVGLCELRVHLHGDGGAKGRRAAVQRIVERVRSRFRASIGEVEAEEDARLAKIGFAVVGADERRVGAVVDEIVRFVDGLSLGVVVLAHRDVFTWGEVYD